MNMNQAALTTCINVYMDEQKNNVGWLQVHSTVNTYVSSYGYTDTIPNYP